MKRRDYNSPTTSDVQATSRVNRVGGGDRAGRIAASLWSGRSGQGGSAPPDLVITAFNGGPAPANWTPPKTPWGEPDLQGVWSSDDATFPASGRSRDRAAVDLLRAPPAASNAAPQGLYLNDEQWAARQKQIQDGIRTARERGQFIPQ